MSHCLLVNKRFVSFNDCNRIIVMTEYICIETESNPRISQTSCNIIYAYISMQN